MTAKEKIFLLAGSYAERLKNAIDGRVAEMQADDVSHYLIYRVLGIAEAEGHLIDVYQNKGRFLYKYAGSPFPLKNRCFCLFFEPPPPHGEQMV